MEALQTHSYTHKGYSSLLMSLFSCRLLLSPHLRHRSLRRYQVLEALDPEEAHTEQYSRADNVVRWASTCMHKYVKE